MLQNEIYTGTYIRRMGSDKRHKITSPETIRVPGGIPSIITADEWNRACEIRRYNSVSMAIYHAKDVYPLSGLVRCSVCGGNMFVRHGGKTRAGQVERYYKCRNNCIVAPRVEAVENATYAAINYFLQDESLIQAACDVANSFGTIQSEEDKATAVRLEKRLVQIAKDNARLIAYIKNNENAPASIMDDLRRLEDEEKDIHQRIESLRRPAAQYDPVKFAQLLRAAVVDIKTLPPSERKARCQAAVHGVFVSDSTVKVLFVCPTSSGDEPRKYIEHIIPRNPNVRKKR